MKNRAVSGFTLVELLVVISITAILLSLGVPSMRFLLEKNAVAAQVNSFIGSVALARSEAIKRNAPIVMCRNANAESSTSTTCASSGTDWKNGWIIFLDRDDDGTFDTANGDQLVQVQGAFEDSGGMVSTLSNQNSLLRFRNTGLMRGGMYQLVIDAPSMTPSQQRRICISTTGRARVLDPGLTSC